jgi:hypothetical protein
MNYFTFWSMDDPWKYVLCEKNHKRRNNSWTHVYEISRVGKFNEIEILVPFMDQ